MTDAQVGWGGTHRFLSAMNGAIAANVYGYSSSSECSAVTPPGLDIWKYGSNLFSVPSARILPPELPSTVDGAYLLMSWSMAAQMRP